MTIDQTDEELARLAARYDAGENEGGEGYNPYRNEQERREAQAAVARPRSLDEQKARLLHRLEIIGGPRARELGISDAGEIAQIEADLAEIERDIETQFAAAWPVALTAARREKWNAEARKHGAAMTRPEIRAVEAELGYRMDDLRRAVALWAS